MAIVIEQQPITGEFNLSGNPITCTFSSNFTAQSNFSYIVDVYVDSILHSTHEVFPENGIYGKFDSSSIADAEIGAPLIPTDINGVDAGDINISLEVFEKYGLTPTIHDSEVSRDVSVIKGKLFSNIWINFDFDHYFILNDGGGFLTQAPSMTIREGEQQFVYFQIDSYNDGYDLYIDFNDANGNRLHSETINNAGYFLNAISMGWNDLDSIYSLDNVRTVSFYVENIDGVYSETRVINIDHCTCPLESTRLHFLSQIGCIDSFSFNRLSRKSMSVQAQSYTTNQGEWNGSGYIYTNQNSQIGNFQTLSESKLKIESGWVDEATQSWLNDNLFTSPYILMETPNGLRRVANMSNSVEYKKVLNDMLFNVTIEIELDTHSSMIV